MGKSTGLRKQQAAATRATLIAVARRLFVTNGYHATAISDLVAAARVTRGALYHHFGGKEQLFEAVFRELADELQAAAGAAVRDLAADPWRQLQEGLQAFLSLVAGSREVQRVLLLDGPVVFGWSRWRETQSEFTFSQLVAALDRLVDARLMPAQATAPLAGLILAALNDAAMSIAHAQNPIATREAAGAALMTLVSGLRATPAPAAVTRTARA
ncbi:MAG: TetR family transcriptional regulator [Phenylobacterium sp.]|nr:TetR family transcriptional regulator [Phenylobacterium sp.]